MKQIVMEGDKKSKIIEVSMPKIYLERVLKRLLILQELRMA